MVTYANKHNKPPLQINFMYLGSKEIHCILRHAA
jgi:hypothetical protein